MDWNEKKRANTRRSASTDSLLSMDEGSDSSNPPALPPKGRFMSTDNLSPPPPALPPKRLSHNLNKRVSVSSVCIGANAGSDTDCLTDGSVAERIKTFMNRNEADNKSKIKPTRRSTLDLSTNDNDSLDFVQMHAKTTAPVVCPTAPVIEDLPKELPSVRNLASKFCSTTKSPEPLPRKSILSKVCTL